MKIKVIYNQEFKVDSVLDKKIIKAMKPLGFNFQASGCNRISGERDLVFSDGN